MNDRQLTQLLRMAAEAERLESGPATLRMPTPTHRRPGLWIGLAAAASVAAAFAFLSLPSPQPKNAPTPVALADPNPIAPQPVNADPCDDESTVLLAIFRNADGSTIQSRIAMKDWDSRRGLNDLGEGELIGFAFEHAEEMTPETLPDSVVLLAVSGPTNLVPHSEAAAAQLTACLEQTPASCGAEVPCYTSAALQCLPAGVSVIGEARAVR
ncbi:MAG: hypothetical protein ACOYN0_09205 [Phycisphaerales bacterium]